MTDAKIRIRPAGPEDTGWITALVPRLHEFGPPPWHDVPVMNAHVAAELARELDSPSPGSAIFAAVNPEGAPLGFIFLETDHDYFTQAAVGHVNDIVVAPEAEGRGVARALLDFADRWAADAGYPWVTLHVFDGNDRARRVYERFGYRIEWTRMLKVVRPRTE